MPIRVHLRPNTAYLIILAVLAAAVGWGVLLVATAAESKTRAGGWLLIVSSTVFLLIFGFPVVASTLLRVPVLIAENGQVRLPMMGPVLARTEITAIADGWRTAGSRQFPVLLVRVTDPAAVIARTRPWLRGDARRNLQRHGTPIVLAGESLNRPLTEIAVALRSL